MPLQLCGTTLALAFATFKGKPTLTVHIPTEATIAGPYVSIVNKTAPNPYAARLWIEYIFSDEGQLFYLKGYAHPARYQALVTANKVPADLAAKLPPASEYTNLNFPSLAQLTAAYSSCCSKLGATSTGFIKLSYINEYRGALAYVTI